MSGDLEDFLRRAAQRRQAKAAQQQQQQPAPRQPPQYSDRHSERRIQPVDEVEEILTAEIVEDDHGSYAAQLQRVEETRRAAAQVERDAAHKARIARESKRKPIVSTALSTGNPAQDLINVLRQPTGIKQAILLREILDRPEHRW